MKSIWLVSFMLFRFRLYRPGAENTANHRLTRRHKGVTFCLRDILSPMSPGRTSEIVAHLDEESSNATRDATASPGRWPAPSERLWRARQKVAHRGGFEPPTPRFVVWCSIQLSYRCLISNCQTDVARSRGL